MKKVILNIGGMSCSACSSGLEKYLNKKEGIRASVNLVLSQAFIEYDETVDIAMLEKYIKEAGFESLGIYNPSEEKKSKNDKREIIIFSVLIILFMYVSMGNMFALPSLKYLNGMKYPSIFSISLLIGTCFFLIYGIDIFKSGYKNLVHKTPNMDTLVSIGVLASFFYSIWNTFLIVKGNIGLVHHLYYESVVMVIYFIKLGRFIDSKSKEKTKEAIQDLVKITPSYASLKTKDGERKVTIDEVKKGSILICRAGDRVAVDGKVIEGESHLDESFITGESSPVRKTKGDKVVAGSINYDGYILYEAEKIGKDSTISEIVRLVVEASNTKAPIAKVADKVSSVFVPIILVLALATLVGYLLLGKGMDSAILHFVNVLVVACPCALGLATPLAIVVSEGKCAKEGILVKTSETLEMAGKIDTIVFDKTGTLTGGRLNIAEFINYSKYSKKEILTIVASIEKNSTHPIAKPFIRYLQENKRKELKVTHFKEFAGIGLYGKLGNKEYYIGNAKVFNLLEKKDIDTTDEKNMAEKGNSILYVVENKKIIALIGVRDTIRTEAKSTICQLQKLGKEVMMLTGDNRVTAAQIAKELGITKVVANVMPKEKGNVIKGLLQENKKVMMVGDGINDAPSLALATIGVSIKEGTDIANNSSDVIVMSNQLASIPHLIKQSKRTMRIIKQNLFWAFFYNVCMIPIAIGLLSQVGVNLNPMIGSFAMMISSFTVIINSLRLRK